MLRLLSGQRIADALFTAHPGRMSRAEIARATGLSKPTVSALMADMESVGLVRLAEDSARSGSIGRPAALYELVPSARHCVIADVGATTLRAGLADLLGNVVAEAVVETGPDARTALERLVQAVSPMLEAAGSPCHAVCVGVPGIYRPELDRVEQSLSLPGFDDVGVAQLLGDEFGARVFVENDVNLAALGELTCLDDEDGGGDFAAVFAGTGIGLGLVVGGKLYRGGTGSAGELGSLVVAMPEPDAAPVTLEDVASAPSIRKRLGQAIEEGRESALDLSADVAEIIVAASRNDAAAAAVFGEVVDAMALAVSHLCLIADPTRIVFGGPIGADQLFVDAVRDRLGSLVTVPPALMASSLGERATLIGAASVSQRHVRESLISEVLGEQQ
ncbi:ROK family transcriptional regulator [Candidatus Poriferisodalis sp.]|uniref:ROK family transcriptional regulator n=1 Tax=Candidatus Poriferisodalis sp. TaxID=3101277 RepID=UPI003B0165C5